MSHGNTKYALIRGGITILELITVAFCIGLLIAITLPAILMVRESARRAQCASNLHQLGVAVANCHIRLGRLPSGINGPYIELASDLELPVFTSKNYVGEHLRQASAVLKCPSDISPPHLSDEFDISVNYFMNRGSAIAPLNGAVKSMVGVCASLQEFTDGLSNTNLFSEHPLVNERCYPCYNWLLTDQLFGPGEEKPLRSYLNSKWKQNKLAQLWNFHYLYSTSVGSMFCVDHLWLPNTPMTFFVPESEFTVSPASFHRGGVNILFADGHVQFITNQIEEDVWVAIGSRNGHEVIREVP